MLPMGLRVNQPVHSVCLYHIVGRPSQGVGFYQRKGGGVKKSQIDDPVKLVLHGKWTADS